MMMMMDHIGIDEDDFGKNLKTGDLVTFYSEQEEEEGYFGKAHDSAVLQPNKSKDCVFKIHPMTQYTARKALKKKKRSAAAGNGSPALGSGIDLGVDQERDPELKQLEEYQDIEEVTNETAMIQLEGRDLVYGQIIQLFHPKSNQFLFAKHYNAKNNIVGFRQDGNQKCYFKIAPARSGQFNGRCQDGMKVQQSDLVLLRHEKTGLFLRETNFFNEKGFFEIGLNEQGTQWKIGLSDVEGKLGLNVVKANEPLRFFHREGGYIKATNDDSYTTFTYNTKTPTSVKSLFELELDTSTPINKPSSMFLSAKNLLTPTITSSNDVLFGQHFRIRLLGTKSYLSLGHPPGKADSHPHLLNSSSGMEKFITMAAGISITVSPSDPNNNNNNNNNNSSNNNNSNIINSSGSAIINNNSSNSSNDSNFKEDIPLILVPEIEKYSPNSTFYFVPKEQSNTEHVTYGSFVRIQSLSKYWLHFINEETFFHNGDLVGTKKYFKYDDYQIKPITKSQMEDYKFVNSRISKINHFVAPQELRKKITLQELRFILIELVKFCTQSECEDPLEREGTPIKTHQTLLATSHNLKVLLDLLAKFFNPVDPLTISYILRIFKQISKSNVKNGIAINKHIKAISGPVEIREKVVSFGLGAVLLDIYKNNHILLENLTEDKVIEFIDAIRQTRDPKYMELLSEICVCNGKPIVKNQQYLCDHLLEKNTDLLLKTRVTSLVEIEVKPGQWMSMSDFMSKGDEKTQRYFEQSLTLYANVSRGRNYNGIRLVGQFASYKECFLCLKDDSLPFILRGSYTNVVIHKDMDCDPQKPYAKITYFWNPLDQTNAIEQQRQNTLGRGTKSSETLTRQQGGGSTSGGSMYNNSTNGYSSNSSYSNIQTLYSGNQGIHGSSTAINSMTDDDVFTMFPPMSEPLHINDPSNISQFLLNYVLRPENFSWNQMYSSNASLQRPQWGFFHKILIAANYAFRFGFFKRKERILLNRLKDILEFQSSDNNGQEMQTDLGRTMGGSRLLEDDSSVLVAIKIEILQILHQMLSLQKKSTFELFLNEMTLSEQVQQAANNQNSSDVEEQIKRLLISKLDGTAMVSQKAMMNHRNSFITTLFNQLKHENNTLTSLVLSLLNRIYKYQNGYAQLYNPIRKLMILPASNVSNNIYSQSVKKMEELTKCCSNPLTYNETEEVLKILAYFIHMCEAGDAKAQKHQNMLKVIGIHNRIIGVLKMGCTLENLFDDKGEVCNLLSSPSNGANNSSTNIHSSSSSIPLETQRIQQSCFAAKIFRSCYEFFRAFCKNNPTNQMVLYGCIEFLIGHLIRYGNIFGTIETLMEVFKNNIKLCVSFGESPYMKLLIEFIIHQDVKDVDPVFLRFLNMIMKPSGYSAVTEIQISISNLLKEYRPIISRWLLPFSTVKEVMKEPKGATISKFHKSNNSSTYKLHACLQEILLHSLQQDSPQDGATGITVSVKSSITQSTQPKLIRSTAKHMLVTSTEEVLPREFVVNLELIWLLSVCSHGRNTPTEIICRDFISMYDCFEVLVVRTDGTGRDASSLMIHDTKEYLEQNLQFRFKSAYVSFLHEVYFNSDTLKGDLLALQLNESLWNLIDQFTNQLKFLYTCYNTNRMSSDYFLMMARSIILPMISILERFYSQCFYYDKATQKHLLYSSVLMGNLLKFYSIDESIRIPTNNNNNNNSTSINGSVSNSNRQSLSGTTNSSKKIFQALNQAAGVSGHGDDEDTSSGGIHPILMGLDLDEKITLLVSLVKCLKAMDRSAISPTATPGITVSSVSEVIKGCEEIVVRLDRQNSKWTRQRSETSDDSVTLISKQSSTYLYDQKEHPMLKLFRERGYQQLALIVLEKDDKALNSLLQSTDSNLKVAANTFLEILVFQLRNTLYENNTLKLHCIRILLSVLEHHPQKKRIMQIQLTEMYCHSACIGLIGSKSHDVALEALNLLLALLEEQSDPTNPVPNDYVKEAIQTYFSSSPDIQFFKNIFQMMERAKMNLRDTKRNLRMEHIKHNITGNLVIDRGNTVLGLVHKHTDVDMVGDTNPYATEFLIMSNIFRVLQLLCQGSSSLFKSYIRSQPDNYKSYDILRELCQFLKILEAIVHIDLDSINLASRFFSCLKEIVKHTPENQIAVTNSTHMCKAICNILRKSNVGDQFKNEKYLDLKIEIMDFLLHVVDREDPRVVSRMIEELDYSVIEENTNMLSSGKSNSADNEKAIKLAAMSFRLVKILADNDNNNTQNRQLADCLQACGEHCRSRIGRVEMFHNSKLERIYFPIPSYSRRLILQAKEQSKIRNDENELQENMEEYMIANEINWNKSAEKLDAFMVWSENKLIELEHRHQLKQQPLSYFISNHYNKWGIINFLFAMVINILLIIYATSGSTEFEDDFGHKLFRAVILPLSIIQTIFSVLTSVSYFIGNSAVIVYKGWIKYLDDQNSFMLRTNKERMQYIRDNFPLHKYILINIQHILLDVKSVYFIFAVIFSFLGLYNPLFYAFHIFQITLKTKALGIVIRAVNINKGTLILMGFFMIQATYVLSIFSYAFFSQYYVDPDNELFCTTLYQCFLGNIFYGVPTSGQLVQFVQFKFIKENSNQGTAMVLAWTVFCVIFYVVTAIFLLNVILGIIVDTFGQLRDQRAQTEDYKANICFICSIDRETFQKKGIDFTKHVEDDHNKWYYLYFFAYLKERVINKQQNQFSDSELNALRKIETNNSLSLFPVEAAISLQGEHQKSDSMLQAIQDMETKITSNISSQNNTIAVLLEEIKLLRQQVNDLSNK